MSSDTVSTPYGDLNRGVLDALQEEYCAASVLAMVEEWDRHIQTFSDEGGLRSRILALHGMLHTVMDGAQVTIAATQTLPDLASDVADEVDEIREMLGRWTHMLSLVRDLGATESVDRDPPFRPW